MIGKTAGILTLRSRRFEWGRRTYLMGVLNLSPDSFSGDGVTRVADAVEQARRFADDGADLIDVGGQSTKPGFEELSIEEEKHRVVPAIEAIVRATSLPLSIDSYRAPVVEAALDAGADMINDIWGFRRDPEVAVLAAKRNVPAVIMHNQRGRQFQDVIGDVNAGLAASQEIAAVAGVGSENLIVDPGFGFGWSVEHNLEMLRRLGELSRIGLPLLVGTSRKSTIGTVLERSESERIWGTAATTAVAIMNGADMIRVHDVAEMIEVSRMTDAIVRGEV